MEITCNHCKKASAVETVSGRSVVAFRATCPHCSTDLHICLNCSLYDTGAYHECRESSAEWVKDKEKMNRCEFFKVKAGTNRSSDEKTSAKSALDDLFK